jgi:hypothetical protein
MANPELRRDRDLDADWIRYAQSRLEMHLRAAVAAGEVEVSDVDGDFGPITEGSVEFFQRQQGLAVDGIIGPDTWAALEAEPPEAPAPDDSSHTAQDPIDLRIPFELELNWDEIRLQQMLQEFSQLRLEDHPSARLTFPQPVSQLFGNAGVKWLELEFNQHPQVYLDITTRAIIGWSNSQGLELGADNEVEAGLRFRRFDLFVSGELDARLHPMVPSGSISGAGTLNLRFRFGEIIR